jgi:hypothetical protein
MCAGGTATLPYCQATGFVVAPHQDMDWWVERTCPAPVSGEIAMISPFDEKPNSSPSS